MNDLAQTQEQANSRTSLSPTEIELLKYISEGLSNREIARRKGVKVKSCENAISRLAKKLEIRQSPVTNQRVLLVRRYIDLENLKGLTL